ncbi:WxcM-like domain-containing protein [Pulveribacter sp.]|uniref:WxcM-like domain-containing protein n=1 Tax=Pulveribacter sp. TaxID=2678893 RepID=UPI0028ADE319|nr:WxcM-like domain-containing protein [Pulveribacter sp.]
MPVSSSALLHGNVFIPASAKIGDFVSVYEGACISEHCAIHGFTQIWSNVRLGAGSSLGSGVILEEPSRVNSQGISLGAGAQVGAGVIICQGVVIGEGSIVKPGSVVEQGVPPYAIVSGVPARVTGYVENLEGGKLSPWHLQANFPASIDAHPLGVGGVTLHRLKKVCDPRGDLSVGEFPKDIPFDPKRYFLVFNVPSEKTRGEHAHHQCHQFLICVKGSCAVVVDDGKSRCEVLLESPDMGIHLPPMTWGIQYKYSNDAVLLVFASHVYDSADYIRNYAEFIDIVNGQAGVS